MGDTIQLRPLFVDGYGNLVDIYLLFNQIHPAGHTYPRHWTGTIWNATVQYVHRASETVYLRADGLTETWIGNVCFALFVNVVFPQKEEAARVAQEALTYVSCLLNADSLLKASTQETEDRARKSMNIDDITLGGNSHRSESQNGDTHHSDISPYQSSWIRKILFPDEFDGQWQRELRRHPHRGLFDSQLNYEQVQAVNSVCKNDYGTLPYCISGPPGTGKTKTLVEIAMQLLKDNIVDHILICAPSDQAADTLALRLKNYLSATQLFRLNGPSRDESEVPRELIGTGYTYMENGLFYLPPFQKLMKYNVVVTSCRDASILMQARLTNAELWAIERGILNAIHPEHQIAPPPLHWGALLVDEAAQAVELDVLPAISIISPPASYPTDRLQPRFVMAGDEKQLGPRTASRNPNFSRSLFARLFERPLYKNHPLSRSNMKPSTDPPVLTQAKLPILYPPFANLIRNYRSHPAILSVPSSLFYNDTLIPEKPPQSSTTKLASCTLWQGRKWPVLYVPNTGADEIEREGGGWYNYSEATQACIIAQKLITEAGVPQEDICIMSPFAAQVRVLRKMMRSGVYSGIAGGSEGYWDVNIGPVEAFQGLEKRVVILCTTRSRPSFVDADVARGLGIVKFPRKMNVALTRAMEGLVVIGHPEVLEMDEEWRQWVVFCVRNGLVQKGGIGWRRGEGGGVGEGAGGEGRGGEEGWRTGVGWCGWGWG
ncbi:P-loop containing nucleoside triphosphate hydrolase protein [Periconia macrospinosa]|uniref:P-loop containing nucleoside triphosphate hydrolase protein n=1 Tax=Periconia macrospinosa TaxID=97972 RepID=A0A2V1D4S6_9PLEO|nr:P-loop containing nucleoside triphosphate hydrolase protein [Periconia macrospinosa]